MLTGDAPREIITFRRDNILIFQWFPVDQLETERLFPTFLRTALRDVPAHTQHIVHVDTDDEGQP